MVCDFGLATFAKKICPPMIGEMGHLAFIKECPIFWSERALIQRIDDEQWSRPLNDQISTALQRNQAPHGNNGSKPHVCYHFNAGNVKPQPHFRTNAFNHHCTRCWISMNFRHELNDHQFSRFDGWISICVASNQPEKPTWRFIHPNQIASYTM